MRPSEIFKQLDQLWWPIASCEPSGDATSELSAVI